MTPVLTRIAFRVGSAAEVEAWAADLPAHGALNVERSEDMAGYPAVFFEDPAGTKLEICALIPKA
jgi:catechol 2,3-dioxygenase-like lactoylglutathione lyase family enzyme